MTAGKKQRNRKAILSSKKCKANVDAGELVGGVCDDCREETEKQESYFKQALRIDVSGQFVMDFRKELVNA
nr:MAG TPA: hypothetical protein [Caudoviricetes sp.]